MNDTPQRVEEILTERAARLANRKSLRAEAVRQREILLIKIGDHLAGIDVAFTKEILRIENLVPVPEASPHLLGVLNVQNDLVCLVEAASFLDLPPHQPAYPWAVLLRHGSLHIALVCDEVLRLEKLPIEAFDEQGIFRHGESLGTLLNISAFLSPLEPPATTSYSS